MSRSRDRSGSRDSDSRRRSRSRSVKRERRSRSARRSARRSRSRERSNRRRSRSHSGGRRSRSNERGRRSRSQSPSKYRKQRHFGDRNDPQKSRCLGIFNLGRRMTEDEFRRTFERYGKLESCKLVYDQKREESRGFGFITYEKTEDAAYAKKDAAGMEINGHEIRIDFSITKRAHSPTPGCYMGSKPGRGDNRGDYRGDYRSDYRSDRGGGHRRSRSRDRHSRRDRRSRSRDRRRSPSPYRRRSPSPYSSYRRSRSR